MAQGNLWWAYLGEPIGSGPGYRGPEVIVQGDAFNRRAISTAVCEPLSSNVEWAGASGNVHMQACRVQHHFPSGEHSAVAGDAALMASNRSGDARFAVALVAPPWP